MYTNQEFNNVAKSTNALNNLLTFINKNIDKLANKDEKCSLKYQELRSIYEKSIKEEQEIRDEMLKTF